MSFIRLKLLSYLGHIGHAELQKFDNSALI
jgi:hypothetical protein